MRARRNLVAALLSVACVALVAGCGSNARGEGILFVSTRDGDYALYTMNPDGSDQGRISKERGDASKTTGLLFQIDPAWSPNGQQIAFASARGGTLDIYVMNADGSNTRNLTSTKDNDDHPTWSPDGQRIAFHRGDDHIYVMNADGSDLHRVTSTLKPEFEPAWSPDGKWLAYTQRTPGTPVREVWLVTPEGKNAHRVTSLDAESYTPAWAPDSLTLAFSSNYKGTKFGIFEIGVDGKGLDRVTAEGSADAFEPAWSPEGNLIAFSRDGAIVLTDPLGTETVLTDPADNDSSPAWLPSSASDEEGG